jgi:uncharacterized protein YicC (UPF0701 family)
MNFILRCAAPRAMSFTHTIFFDMEAFRDVLMRDDAARVWESKYSSDPSSIVAKLILGDDAYRRAQTDQSGAVIKAVLHSIEEDRKTRNAESDLVKAHIKISADNVLDQVQKTQNSIDSAIRSSDQSIKEDIRDLFLSRDVVEAAKAKCTKKGVIAEGDLVAMLLSNKGIASASRITERDAFGKVGGDVIVRDLHDNGCVIELKDKLQLTQKDFQDFEAGAARWTGAESMFIFVRKDGVGTSRELNRRPLLQYTPQGRTLMWFKGSYDELAEKLPHLIAMHAIFKRSSSEGSDCAVMSSALHQASEALKKELACAEKDLGSNEKHKAELQERIRRIKSTLDSLTSATMGDGVAGKRCRTFTTHDNVGGVMSIE